MAALPHEEFRTSAMEFAVWGVKFRVWSVRLWGWELGVCSLGFRVSGDGFRLQLSRLVEGYPEGWEIVPYRVAALSDLMPRMRW